MVKAEIEASPAANSLRLPNFIRTKDWVPRVNLRFVIFSTPYTLANSKLSTFYHHTPNLGAPLREMYPGVVKLYSNQIRKKVTRGCMDELAIYICKVSASPAVTTTSAYTPVCKKRKKKHGHSRTDQTPHSPLGRQLAKKRLRNNKFIENYKWNAINGGVKKIWAKNVL